MTTFVDSIFIILKPTEAFMDWLYCDENLKQLSKAHLKQLSEISYPSFRANATVIAIPVTPNASESYLIESEKYLQGHADQVLSIELSRWGLEDALKPQKPSYELLVEWFDMSCHSRIITLDL